MAIAYSPELVPDSLAGCWDFGNIKSYDPRENLFLHSNAFTNAVWNQGSYIWTSGAVGAPDGTLTGWQAYNNSTGNFNFFSQMNSTSVGGIYTYSIYIKKLNFSTVTILCGINNMQGANSFVYNFDTDTVSFPFAVPSGLFIDTRVIDAPNGWKRAILTFDSSVLATQIGQTITNVGGGGYVGTAGNTSAANTFSAYFWGAQLERNLTPSTYSATTTSQYTRSTSLTDISGYGNNITLAAGNPTWSSNNGGFLRFPGTAYFSGTGNNNLPTRNAGYTLQAWIRYPTTTISNSGGFISIGTVANPFGQYTSIRNLQAFGSLSHWWVGNNMDITTNVGNMVANQWYLVTGVYYPFSLRRLYLNTTLIASDSPSETHNVPQNPTVEIGRSSSNIFLGDIAHCAVYRTALDLNKITQNYNALAPRFNA